MNCIKYIFNETFKKTFQLIQSETLINKFVTLKLTIIFSLTISVPYNKLPTNQACSNCTGSEVHTKKTSRLVSKKLIIFFFFWGGGGGGGSRIKLLIKREGLLLPPPRSEEMEF